MRPVALLLLSLASPALGQSGGSLMGCPATGADLLALTQGQPMGCACWQPGSGPVWGTDLYAAESAICAAALHAGVIARPTGGPVRVVPAPGQARYTGSARNGIVSADRGASAQSFRFERNTDRYGVPPGR
ncbi:MAG TPA: LCCL domain-containing protein [Acetobacteraceae bacterium]|nr:LCCL domain-containing protein [Acetobacteraceae bacterium]